MKKRGYFFSLDALIALIVIIGVILVIHPIVKQKAVEMNLQEDTIKVLSSIKIGEIDNSYVRQLISERKITNLNQTVLEQIGEFYAREMPEAEILTGDILSKLKPGENLGLWMNNQFMSSYNKSGYENAERIWTAREIISGIEKGQSVKGYSSRAFLSRTSRVKYFYFGGYMGDGNITAKINYEGTLKTAEIEAAFGKDFDLYINGQFIQHYPISDPLTPEKIDLANHLGKFAPGANYIEFRGNNLYIAGGYIKIIYDDSETFSYTNIHQLPGVNGLINLYDSFYIPGSLSSMNIFLHYKSPYVMFLNIGNKTVYSGASSDETTITVDNSQISSMLNYADLSRKTIPLRLGLYELQKAKGGNADVVLITDLSGSMDDRMNLDSTGVARSCTDPNLYSSDTKRISVAKCLDKQVVDIILNVSGNRLALSGFYGDADSPYKGRVYQENLMNDGTYLKSKIDVYSPQGGTCICCAINDGYKILNEQSNSSRQKFVIVMSDGIPTHTCQAASGCTGTRTGLPSEEGLWLGYGAGCYGGLDDCNVNDCQCASTNTNWSSCRVQKDLNATVYSIGFGPVASCQMANKTLRDVANCGNGKYYSSDNASLLQEFYTSISREIVELSYIEQISRVSGIFNNTILYPDSYIAFNYTADTIPYGLAITMQTENFGNSITEGSFNVPSDTEIVEASVVSYSGSKWTDNVYVQNGSWKNVFSLANYGSNYLELGDAYVVNIPLSYLKKGNNTFKITTGTTPANSSGGSTSDKAIYTLLKPVSGYSKISSTANGCKWYIEFEDYSNATINVPLNYSGSDVCYYNSKQIAYNNNDAIDNAIYDLLSSLDLNANRRIETKFTEQDLQISSVEVAGIPYTWSSEVQVRVWR